MGGIGRGGIGRGGMAAGWGGLGGHFGAPQSN